MHQARQTGPALEAHFQFLLWLVPTVEKFPRSQKFLLGDRISDGFRSISAVGRCFPSPLRLRRAHKSRSSSWPASCRPSTPRNTRRCRNA